MGIILETGKAAVDGNVDGINELYDSTFSAPPFVWVDQNAVEHRKMLADISRDPTFDGTVATCHGRVVGFAYGHRLPVDHGWWSDFAVRLAADLTSEWEGRTFALIDFAVDVSRRGQGIGRRLLDDLLDRRPEERVILSVQPTAIRTQQIYLHLGWQRIGRKGPIAGAQPPCWDIFLRVL